MSREKLNRQKKQSETLTRKDKVKAAVIAFVLLMVILIGSTAYYIDSILRDYAEEQLFENVDDGNVVLPSGEQLVNDGSLRGYIENYMDSPYLTRKEKEKILEYLKKQDIDTAYYEAYLDNKEDEYVTSTEAIASNDTESIDDTESDEYKDFLVDNGYADKDDEVTTSDSGLKMINGKSAVSYSNLHDAEVAFGMRLGLYTYVDSLENYEMISAYTVETEFLQCVYAINQDGSKLTEGEDIENADISTITVKLSSTLSAEDLISVYTKYKEQFTQTLDNTKIYYTGDSEDDIKLIYCERPDGRNYSIRCADGLKKTTSESLVNELFANLIQIENGEQ